MTLHRTLYLTIAALLATGSGCSSQNGGASLPPPAEPAPTQAIVSTSIPSDEPSAASAGAEPTSVAVPPVVIASAFTSPADDASVSSPVEVCLAVSGVDLESGDPDSPHILVMIDPSSQEVRRVGAPDAPVVPSGPNYIHFPPGAMCHSLELTAGRHILLGLVARADGSPMNPQGMARVGIGVE